MVEMDNGLMSMGLTPLRASVMSLAFGLAALLSGARVPKEDGFDEKRRKVEEKIAWSWKGRRQSNAFTCQR